jgi:hypothetical protein
MIIDFHGERSGDRAIGRPRTASVADLRDPATAALITKRLLQSGAWRTAPKTGDDTDKALYYLRVHTPAALAVLPRVAVAALTKNPPSPGCHWCAVAVQVRLSFGAETEPPRDELMLKVLGQPCSRCRVRHDMAESAAAEREHLAEVAAASLSPAAAGRLRTREQIRRQVEGIKRLRETRPAPPPTRAIAAAGGRRVPDPAYFQRRPIRWPAEARGVR